MNSEKSVSFTLKWYDFISFVEHIRIFYECFSIQQKNIMTSGCETPKRCVCVFVIYEDTNLYNDMGITRRR